MKTINQLSDALADFTGIERTYVRLHARRLKEAGVLPESRPGPGVEGKPKATAEHAAALIVSLLAADQPDHAPQAVAAAMSARFVDAYSQTQSEGLGAGSAAYAPDSGVRDYLAGWGCPSAFMFIGSMIVAYQAGTPDGSIEFSSLWSRRHPDGIAFVADWRKVGPFEQSSEIKRAMFYHSLSNEGLPPSAIAYSAEMPGNILQLIADELGPLTDDERGENEDLARQYLATLADGQRAA